MFAIRLLFRFIFIIGFVARVSSFSLTNWISERVYEAYEAVEEKTCLFTACCDGKWERQDFLALHSALNTHVFGQNVMMDVLVPALQGHLMPSAPRGKALAISLHGRPGIGKNYVVGFIQNVLFHKRSRNKHVHFFTGRIHFPLDSHAALYRAELAGWIKGNVSKCEYSLFIFDEVDKMPPGVLDAVNPFIDYHDRIDGIDFRKCIFIFISNTGGDLIAKQFLKYWQNGQQRENLRLADFENLIRIGAFNEKGGLFRSDAIESSLIDHYIPFLPLEEKHVIKCIINEFRKRSARPLDSLVKEVLGDMTFGPEDIPIFSNGGCKRISPKVAAIIERTHFRSRSYNPDL